MKDVELAEDVDVVALAERTEGYSGADVASVCRDASMMSVRRMMEEARKQGLQVRLFLCGVEVLYGVACVDVGPQHPLGGLTTTTTITTLVLITSTVYAHTKPGHGDAARAHGQQGAAARVRRHAGGLPGGARQDLQVGGHPGPGAVRRVDEGVRVGVRRRRGLGGNGGGRGVGGGGRPTRTVCHCV